MRAQPLGGEATPIYSAAGDIVPFEELADVELSLRRRFRRDESPSEVFALATATSPELSIAARGARVAAVVILIYGDIGELRWYDGSTMERYYYRDINAAEIARIRQFVDKHRIASLPDLPAARLNPAGEAVTYSGADQHVYLHLNTTRGHRLRIDSPPHRNEDEYPADHSIWAYRDLIDFFMEVRRSASLQVSYAFARPIDGLETVYAPATDNVLSVWKQGSDLCITVRSKRMVDAKERHYRLVDGRPADQVHGARRTSIHSTQVGRDTLRPFRSSLDGRWVVGNSITDERLVCFDRRQREQTPLSKTALACYPLYYLEEHAAFLVARFRKDLVPFGKSWSGRHEYWLLDPLSGELRSVRELQAVRMLQFHDWELWFQDLPRRLQEVQDEARLVWVAIPRRKSTQIGQFDLRTFRWVRQAWIPHLQFDTRQCWVDDNNRTVYVAYLGHLIRFSLPGALADGGGPVADGDGR